MLVRIWDNTDNMNANNNALQDLVNELNDQLKIRDDEITELRQEITSLKSKFSIILVLSKYKYQCTTYM